LDSNYYNSYPMKVTVLAQRNRIDGTLRTGIALRLLFPPEGVRYKVMNELIPFPSSFNDYHVNWRTGVKWTFKLFLEPICSLRLRGLVHSFFLNLYIPMTPWVQELDQPISAMFGSYFSDSKFRDLILGFFRKVFNRENVRMVTWTEWSRRGLEQEGFRNINVIPPPMNSKRRDSYGRRTVIFVGLDYRRKGGDVAEKVMSSLPGEFNKIYVGKSPNRVKGVIYIEKMSRDELIELMRRSDVMIFPTRGDAFGLSVLEAMSVGTPVVTSNVGPMPEIVGEGGIVCAKDDVQCFLENTKEILSSSEYAKRLGSNAIREVETRFSPAEIGKKLVETYGDLADPR
jgi:glycosyltransferase involved in cell wall biosynthesis